MTRHDVAIAAVGFMAGVLVGWLAVLGAVLAYSRRWSKS